MLSVVGVVVAMAVIIGGALAYSLTRDSGTDAPSSSSYSLGIGKKSAPHTVVVYEDFLCPYCQAFEAASRAQLTKLAQQGKVYVEYRPFHFLDPDYSLEALNAFAVVKGAYPSTSPTGVAKKFHDLLYENQPSEQGPFPSTSDLVDLAVKAGAAKSKVEDGIKDTSSEKDWTDGATKEALATGLQGTPTVLLDGTQFQQGSSVEDIASNLIKQLS